MQVYFAEKDNSMKFEVIYKFFLVWGLALSLLFVVAERTFKKLKRGTASGKFYPQSGCRQCGTYPRNASRSGWL